LPLPFFRRTKRRWKKRKRRKRRKRRRRRRRRKKNHLPIPMAHQESNLVAKIE
jgi:transposase